MPTILISSTLMPCHNGRVVIQPNQFIYLGESFEVIPKENEIDPTYYDEECYGCTSLEKGYGVKVRMCILSKFGSL